MILPTAKTVTENQAKTRQGRVCLFGTNSNVPFDKVTPQKGDNHYTVHCYPNYKVSNHQIDFNSFLPLGSIQREDVKELKIKHYLPEKDSHFDSLNNSGIIRGVGQILVVYVRTFNPKRPDAIVTGVATQGTCFLTQLQDNMPPKVISVFHVLNLEPSNQYDIFAIANFTEFDLGSDLSGIYGEFNEENEAKHLQKYDARAQHILKRLKDKLQEKIERRKEKEGVQRKEDTLDLPLFLLVINHDFLNFRRNYLKEHIDDEEFVKNILLDPFYGIKPSPAIDIALFEVPKELRQNKDIPWFTIGNTEESEEIILIMFACPEDLKLKTKGKEYGEVFSGDKDFEEVVDGLMLTEFIHKNKSASYGRLYKDKSQIQATKTESSPIVIFYGSTCGGASGGPLLNHKGQVIAVNFANYQDREKSEPLFSDKLYDNQFDVNVSCENKEKFKACKNCNLAISMKHPIIQEYLLHIQEKNALAFFDPNQEPLEPQENQSLITFPEELASVLPGINQGEVTQGSILQKRPGEEHEPGIEEIRKRLHQ